MMANRKNRTAEKVGRWFGVIWTRNGWEVSVQTDYFVKSAEAAVIRHNRDKGMQRGDRVLGTTITFPQEGDVIACTLHQTPAHP